MGLCSIKRGSSQTLSPNKNNNAELSFLPPELKVALFSCVFSLLLIVSESFADLNVDVVVHCRGMKA